MVKTATIQDAYDRLYELCEMENPYCLYSQSNRYMGTDSEGNIYFDCSSIISYVLWYAGILETNPWFTTYNMADYLTEDNGFTSFDPNSVAWANGDIMVRHDSYEAYPGEHTEMVYSASEYRTMGAHTSSYERPDQVSVSSYSSRGNWQIGYRYADGWVPSPTVPWTVDNYPDGWEHFTEWPWHTDPGGGGYTMGTTESMDNARNVFTYAWQVGWKRYAICALLGNMQAESGLNPGRHEDGGEGFGLVQWTPERVLEAAMRTIFGDVDDDMLNGGHYQMLVILGEYMTTNYWQGRDGTEWGMNVGIERQWYNSNGSNYGFDLEPIDWYDWATAEPEQSDETSINEFLETLTLQFMVSYLRPSYDPDSNHWEMRVQFTLAWYALLADFSAPRPGGGAVDSGFLYCPKVPWRKYAFYVL